MEEKNIKKESTWIKLLPSIIIIIGILVGLWQFNKEINLRDRDEFRRNVWKKQLEVYEKVGNATAKIVNSTSDSIKFEMAVEEYKNLYWGVMPLIQDEIVEKAMIKFNSEIRYFKRKEGTTEDLRIRGYKLMRTCKKSLNESWKNLTKI